MLLKLAQSACYVIVYVHILCLLIFADAWK